MNYEGDSPAAQAANLCYMVTLLPATDRSTCNQQVTLAAAG